MALEDIAVIVAMAGVVAMATLRDSGHIIMEACLIIFILLVEVEMEARVLL